MRETDNDLQSFLHGLPKAELHIHIEGSLEPELKFELAARNGVHLPFASVEEMRRAYAFTDLQSFLDVYYEGARVLIKEEDFFDLTWAYLVRVHEQNTRHVEVFFDPQTHTERGVRFEAVITGIRRALEQATTRLEVSSKLILCFLRHLSSESAMETLEQALDFKEWIVGVGLDSSELGHPPSKFRSVFERALAEGFLTVAHAGEEGPPSYIWEAMDILKVSRIDHGIRCLEDPTLVEALKIRKMPLTVCPLSNVKLGCFPRLSEHNLKRLLEAGLIATVNSDDPAYFGGYIGENFLAVAEELGLSRSELTQLAKNGFLSSFLPPNVKRERLDEIAQYVSSHESY